MGQGGVCCLRGWRYTRSAVGSHRTSERTIYPSTCALDEATRRKTRTFAKTCAHRSVAHFLRCSLLRAQLLTLFSLTVRLCKKWPPAKIAPIPSTQPTLATRTRRSTARANAPRSSTHNTHARAPHPRSSTIARSHARTQKENGGPAPWTRPLGGGGVWGEWGGEGVGGK